MSDASDAVSGAVARTKRLAAGLLVRKEELEAELQRRRADRAGLDALGEGAEVQAVRAELDARLAALGGELATVEGELAAAKTELGALGKLAGTARVAGARVAVDEALAAPDPLIRTAEEQALDHARGHIADLEAQVRLEDELAGGARPAAQATQPAAQTARPRTREEADAEALAEFQARRAKPKKTI